MPIAIVPGRRAFTDIDRVGERSKTPDYLLAPLRGAFDDHVRADGNRLGIEAHIVFDRGGGRNRIQKAAAGEELSSL